MPDFGNPFVLSGLVLLGVSGVVMVVYAGFRWYRASGDDVPVFEQEGVSALPGDVEADSDGDEPVVVELSPPNIRESRFGVFGALLSCYRYQRKRRNLASKGYVQTYLVDGTWPRPKFVKPKLKGGGIPEAKIDGDRYLFPKSAKLPSQSEGVWTFVHKKGEIEPVNVQDPTEGAISPDELDEYLTMRLAKEPPGWLSGLDVDPSDLIMYAIVAIIAYGFLRNVMGGVL